MARVGTLKSLANERLAEAEMMRERYMPPLRFEPIKMTLTNRPPLFERAAREP